MFKKICWANWLFIIMIGGLALISITSSLSGCGNKSNLVLPVNSSDQTPATTAATTKNN